MNMAERVEDIDYQPDVLKFKKIWEEMSETTKPKNNREGSREPNKSKSKNDQKTKDQSTKEKPK